MYEWLAGNSYQMTVTLNATNMTLNSPASSYFKGVRWVMIGLDATQQKLAIKPIQKRDIDMNLVSMDRLQKISIGKGYGRITNKRMMQTIEDTLGCILTGQKVYAEYNDKEDIMEIDLTDLVNED